MGELVSFYSPDKEGVQSDDEAIVYAERHVEDGDEGGYGYTHCVWCSDEWPCTTAALLNIIQRNSTEKRLKIARGNTSYGGTISSLGAVGSGEMPHARESRSDGRPSWIGRGNW